MSNFLSERKQIVRFKSLDSDDITLSCGIPQGSVLGPKRFTEYVEDVSTCFVQHRLRFHLYADDMQGLQHGKPAEARAIVSSVESCVDDVRSWCASKRLQLNASKTEVLWFGTAAQLRKVPKCDRTIRVGGSVVEPVSVVRDLGVYVDTELTMQEHVSRTARACFFHIRRLRSVRRELGRQVTAQLVSALILSRLDYCNAVLAGLPASTLAPLQRVLNAAARLVLELGPRDHVSAALHELHWLPIRKRIDYKLCLLAHNVRIGHAPEYMTELLTATSDVPSKATLRSSNSGDFVIPATRLRLGDRAFSVAAARAWNTLPTELKSTHVTSTFKRKLKTFLYDYAYKD